MQGSVYFRYKVPTFVDNFVDNEQMYMEKEQLIRRENDEKREYKSDDTIFLHKRYFH